MTDTEIVERWPELFIPSVEIPGGAVGPGWDAIVSLMCDNLRDTFVPHGIKLRLCQLKEKFGGLRVYIEIADGTELSREEIRKMYDLIFAETTRAEQISINFCEDCGRAGRRRMGGWIRTLCDEHAEMR